MADTGHGQAFHRQRWWTAQIYRPFRANAGTGSVTQLNQYERAMRERNKLLQTPGTQFSGNGWLDGLEENMASLGTAIAAARLAALDALAEGWRLNAETVFPAPRWLWRERLKRCCGRNRRLRLKMAGARACKPTRARCAAGRSLEACTALTCM